MYKPKEDYLKFKANNKIENFYFARGFNIPSNYIKRRLHQIHFGLITLLSDFEEDSFEIQDYATGFAFEYKHNDYFIVCEDDGLYAYYNQFNEKQALEIIDKLNRFYKEQYEYSQEEKKDYIATSKDVSLLNYYPQEIMGLQAFEETINKEYRGSIPYTLLQQTLGHFDGPYTKYIAAQFEIECYIRTVFSLIEHMATLLLPLLEYKNGEEWCLLKRYARDEFIPDSWATFVLQKKNNDKVVNIFFDMVKHFNPTLSDYYWTLKKDLRNVLEHGYISGIRLDNISYYSPSLDIHSIRSALVQDSNYFVEIDYLAYQNCKALLDMFKKWINKIDPVFLRIIEVANLVPADPTELLTYANGNPDKINEFYTEVESAIFNESERVLSECEIGDIID